MYEAIDTWEKEKQFNNITTATAYEIAGAEIRRVGLDMYNSNDERAEDFRKAYNLINECCGGIFNKGVK